MWMFFFRRLRTWVLLAIALPLVRCLSTAWPTPPNVMIHRPVRPERFARLTRR